MKFLFKIFIFYCFFLKITVAAEIGDKRSEEIFDDYNYACGDEFMETKCKCNGTELNCDSSGVKDLNIHIIAENFTVKIAKFKNAFIQILKKRKILPGREYSIQTLDFQYNWISEIENGTFDKFMKLEVLILSNNRLTNIDENVLTENLGKTLKSLDLKENKLQKLTFTTFMYLNKLEFLDLSFNPGLMPYFNEEVFSKALKNLKKLDLSWCNISTLEDTAFKNLLNLETLQLTVNPLMTVPKAIKSLSSLRTLCLSHTNLKTLNEEDFGFNSKLKRLNLIGMSNLTAVNDCAFCNFPNLETIIFWGSTKQTISIHENAFGSITSGKLYPKIKEIDIIFTRLSTLPERLIDWRKADRVEISTIGINCDCSMAWLINDFRRSDSLFSKTIKITLFFKGLTDECIAPPEFKGKKVKDVSGKICNGKLSTVYQYPSTSSATFKLYWIFLVGIFILGISIFSFTFHKKIIKFIYYQNVPQQENDDSEKIFQYRNLENDSV